MKVLCENGEVEDPEFGAACSCIDSRSTQEYRFDDDKDLVV
jgi:hypothetical protein